MHTISPRHFELRDQEQDDRSLARDRIDAALERLAADRRPLDAWEIGDLRSALGAYRCGRFRLVLACIDRAMVPRNECDEIPEKVPPGVDLQALRDYWTTARHQS